MKEVSRYHPVLVALHWIVAVLIIGALMTGFLGLARTPNSDQQKIGILLLHMSGGMLIFALMLIRFIVRWRTSKPAKATTGHRLLDRFMPIAHYGFYVLVVLMVGTGYATAILAGLPEIVFAGSGDPLPASFEVYPTRVVHGYLAILLASLVGVHVLAALYHQFGRKDRLFRRMLFGRRARDPDRGGNTAEVL